MIRYTVGDVERLLGLKVHVIRYWERAIPLVQPSRDSAGRRHYSSRDLQILLRTKYLIRKRHFTLEGARDQIFRELAGDHQDLRSQIAALRSELVDLYFLVHPRRAGEDEKGETP
ncbi:MAG: MerR family transcriptional regulator [Treponema sp.]|jgi:DNA-binding transcriptional MerR regulator|nr:MerR family transcriptional regulator [Treponema sp.]